jgi:hypothetical protein
LTCPEDDNQWIRGSHHAHVSWAGSDDVWLGLDKNWLWFAQLFETHHTFNIVNNEWSHFRCTHHNLTSPTWISSNLRLQCFNSKPQIR